jgi:poly(3-hydroxybutyrate) depolymerase
MNIKVLLGLAFLAHSFSCADAVRVVGKSPLDTIARELKDKPGKESSSSHGGADKEESSTSTSKGGKNPPPPNESNPLFVTSASCPQECLSANYAPDSHLLTDAIEQCDAESYHQQWEFLKVGTFNMLKNVGASDDDESTDWCLGVVPQEADTSEGLGDVGPEAMCNGGKLGLVSCGDPASQWYATGGQLISSHCYALGFSSILSVDEGCNDLFVSMATPDNDNGITRSQTFLAVDKKFIESIPSAQTDALSTPAPKTQDNVVITITAPKTQDNVVITITVEDYTLPWPRFLEREFMVFDPAKNEEEGDAQPKRPVVIAYHGANSNSQTMSQLTQFDKQARDRNWLAVYPQAELRLWNGAGCCSRLQDDVAFTKAMIDYLIHNFNVDENKVYVAGMSNGGFMVYELLCEMGNRDNGNPWIAAAAVHSGLLGAWEADFSTCSLGKVPLVHFHGLEDNVVNITGKPKGEQVLGLPIEFVTNAEWKSLYNSIDLVANKMCNSGNITNTSNPTESTTCYELCEGKVEYCLVEKLEHQYSGCSDASLAVYDPNYVTNVDATAYFADFFASWT